jgi:hypothetical protein
MSEIEVFKSLLLAGVEYIANFIKSDKSQFIILFDKDCQAVTNGTIEKRTIDFIRFGVINHTVPGNSIRSISKLIKRSEGYSHE